MSTTIVHVAAREILDSRGYPTVEASVVLEDESCGEAAVYLASADMTTIADALETILFDEGTRQRVRAAAPAVLARYDWATAARETLDVITAHA